MRITEKQIHVLVRVLEGSLNILDNGNYFGYDVSTRRNLYNEIINQQSNELIDINENNNGIS